MPTSYYITTNSSLSGSASSGMRFVDPTGIINNVSSLTSTDPVYVANGGLKSVEHVCVDPLGNLYVCDARPSTGIAVLYKIAPNGVVTHLAGIANTSGLSGMNGPAASAGLVGPTGVALDSHGNIYLNDAGSRVLCINTQGSTQVILGISIGAGNIAIVAGTGTLGDTGDGGAATSAQIRITGNATLAVDAAGNLYLASVSNAVLRKVTTAGIINVYAGTGSTLPPAGDGNLIGSSNVHMAPVALFFDALGNLYISDIGFNTIRVVNNQATPQTFYNVIISPGTINRIAGTGGFNDSGDGGPATGAGLSGATSFQIDGSGNLLFSEFGSSGGGTVRQIAPSGIITTLAGIPNTGVAGNTGNGGPATLAHMWLACGLAIGTAIANLPSTTITVVPGAIQNGMSAVLTWTSTNATSVVIDVLGTVALNGSTVVDPSVTTTYNITATGPGGVAHASVMLNVGPAPTPFTRKVLTQVDTWELDHGEPDWPSDQGTPISWWETTLDQQTVSIAPTPDQVGQLNLLYVQLAAVLDGTGVALTVPDDWSPYILWGTLAELLSSDGPAYDPVRANYCKQRYDEGVELARLVLGG